MSIGAIRELTRACIEKFKRMVEGIPNSERKEIIKIFEKQAKILEGI